MLEPAVPARFGAVLRRLRNHAGLTQARLAEQAHISQRGLQDLERGVHHVPRRDTLDLLAAALGLVGQERVAFLAAAQPPPARRAPVAPAVTIVPDALAPLVGREGELARLNRFLAGEDARAAAAPVLLLSGEPGIGKTRLLQAAAQLAVPRGWCVLFGGCERRGGEDPYAPFLAALAHYIGLLPPERLGSDLAGCAWLVRLLPELAGVLEPLPNASLAPEQERRLIHAAVARFLANVAGPAGTLLILDDLQWAGLDALDLLNALARWPAAARIVGAYRDTEGWPTDPLGSLLADLAQARLVTRQPLGPLAADSAAALLADLLVDTPGGPGPVDEVLRRAGGTPFFLVSYAQALRQGSAGEVPWDLAQGVRQRVGVLPDTARMVLGAAAVVGRRAARDVLATVVGQPEEQILAGLEAACGARLLLEDGDDAYVFAHDLIREVVEADLGAARRAVLHRRVAEALESAPIPASAELLAYHYGRAGSADKAVLYLEVAGDQAWAQRAHGAAEAHYREVLERLERLGRVHDALRAREKLGDVLHGAGRYDAALAVLEPAAAAYGVEGDLAGLVRVTAAMGWIHRFQGTTLRGIARITALLERLEPSGASPPPLATLYQALSRLLFTAGQYDASLTAGERAAALARAGGDDRTLALAEEHRINVLQMLGRLTEALRVGEAVLPLAERVGDLNCLVGLHFDVAYIHVLRGALAAAGLAGDRAVAHAEQLGNPDLLAFALAVRGWIAVLSGAWTRARADLDRAVSVSRQTDRSWYSGYLPIFQARLSLAEGAWAAASATAQRALSLAEASGDLQALRWASTTMAEVEIREDRPDSARARLVPLLDRPGLEECDVTLLLPTLAWAQLELGQVDEAAATVAQALRRARPEAMRLVLVDALRVQALVALRRERWDAAAASLEEGLALAREMPYPDAEARLLRLDAAVQARRGELAAARERLEAAGAIFARLGARRDAAQVDRAITDLPRDPSRTQSSPLSVETRQAAAQ